MAEEKTKSMKRIWDNFEEVCEVRKSDKRKFVIAAATREGYRCINIREFYYRKSDNSWQPGREGIIIPLKTALNKGEKFIAPFSSMLKALTKASEVAATMELMDENNAIFIERKQK